MASGVFCFRVEQICSAYPFVASSLVTPFRVFTFNKALSFEEVGAMSSKQAVPATKGVTVELLATIDLGPEIEGMAGRQLRMRRVTLAPGAVFGPVHDHIDRPGTVFILEGTITDHRDGETTDYGPGLGWHEDRHTRHWLENRGTVPAVEVSVDIVRTG